MCRTRRRIGGNVDITAHWAPDARRAFRVNAYLYRWLLGVGATLGVLILALVLAGLAAGARFGLLDVLGVLIGVACIAEGPLVLWFRVVRLNKAIGKEIAVSVTEDGIGYRAGLVSMDVPWGRVQRVVGRKDCWVLFVDRVHRIVLYREAFTREQQGELSLFLATRPS